MRTDAAHADNDDDDEVSIIIPTLTLSYFEDFGGGGGGSRFAESQASRRWYYSSSSSFTYFQGDTPKRGRPPSTPDNASERTLRKIYSELNKCVENGLSSSVYCCFP